LAIETSAEACSVAVRVNGETRERIEHAPRRHAELLLPFIDELMTGAGLELSGLDAIAFGRGPGSFTSLRIGIGVVQGLAWGAEIPVVPVSSLTAVAHEASTLADAPGGDSPAPLIRVALDARMQEVYTADFLTGGDGLVRVVGDERVCPPEAVGKGGGDPFIAAGNGFERFEQLQRLGESALRCHPGLAPRASMVCELALHWLQHHDPLPAALAQPVYIRNDVASKPSQGSLA